MGADHHGWIATSRSSSSRRIWPGTRRPSSDSCRVEGASALAWNATGYRRGQRRADIRARRRSAPWRPIHRGVNCSWRYRSNARLNSSGVIPNVGQWPGRRRPCPRRRGGVDLVHPWRFDAENRIPNKRCPKSWIRPFAEQPTRDPGKPPQALSSLTQKALG